MSRNIRFKGRVIEVRGSQIVIDTKADYSVVKTEEGIETKIARWDQPEEMPKVGDIVRCIFRARK